MTRTARLQRQTFSTSRLLEYFSEKELVLQTGHEPDGWPEVVVKELVDSALDACEESDVLSDITIDGTRTKGRQRGQPVSDADRAPRAERAAFSGICEQCREPFRGRMDKRFCCDAHRTRFGREKKAREMAELTERLVRLTRVKA